MRLKASGFVFWALFVACSSDKSDDDDTGGKSGSGGSVTSGGASGAGKSGAGGTTAGAGSGGGAGKAGGTGGTLAGQGGSSAGAAASAGMDNDPSILASEPVEIDELELDAERVYWLEGHKDILSVPDAEILKTQVLYTIVNGKVAYRASTVK